VDSRFSFPTMRSTAISRNLEWPHGPRAIQLILKRVFVGKAIEAGRRRLFRGWEHDQHAIATAFCAAAPPAAEGESIILPQYPRAANSVRAEPGR